jgi:enoyl-CoA hydratase/carnithine racemase
MSRANGIATITLNRPDQLNAINRNMIDELHAAVVECEGDSTLACMILTGKGRAFCAGDDLKEMPNEFVQDEQFSRSVEKLQDISRLLVLGDKPVIAAVRGWAVGGGLSWVVNSDVSILAENTVSFFPEVRLGLSVTGGVNSLLPAAIGRSRAHSMLMLGQRINASEALEYGLATTVVPDADLEAAAMEHASAIAALPAAAVAGAKRNLNRLARNAFEQSLALEAENLARLTAEMISSRAWPRIE